MSSKDRLEKLAALLGLQDVTALADVVGIKAGTVQKHKDRDSIPKKAVPRYQRAALIRGVEVSADWLQYGRGQAPKPPPPNFVIRTVPKLPLEDGPSLADKDNAHRVPLWHFNVMRQEAGATVPTLTESSENISAPPGLLEFKRSFAVRMWDASNGPYLPRGTILYVERPHDGSPGRLCLFAHSHNDREVIRPVVGILNSEDDQVWHVTQDTKKVTLPKSEYAICWRIRSIRQD